MTCLLQEYEDHPTRLDKRCLEQLKRRKELWELSVQVGILFYRTKPINVGEDRRVNEKRTIQRNWQHRVHKTKRKKTKTQHNMCWTPLYVNKPSYEKKV